MVREVVIKYPLILGTAIEKIDGRLAALQAASAPWEEFITVLRRSEDKHERWMQKSTTRVRPGTSSGNYTYSTYIF